MRATHAACAALVADLQAAGFTGSALDPAALDPSPAAIWVQPRFVHSPALDGSATLTAWLYVIVRHNEYLTDWQLLDDALAGLLEVLDDRGHALADDEQTVDLAAAVLLDGHDTPSPAYRVTVDIDLEGDATP